MVPAGTRCQIVANEREDYIGDSGRVTLDDDGRPVMNLVTERDDGTDLTIYAPQASAFTSTNQ